MYFVIAAQQWLYTTTSLTCCMFGQEKVFPCLGLDVRTFDNFFKF